MEKGMDVMDYPAQKRSLSGKVDLRLNSDRDVDLLALWRLEPLLDHCLPLLVLDSIVRC